MRNAFVGLPPDRACRAPCRARIWFRSAQWLMDTCQARFGDMFTLKIANEGTWVVTSDPDAIKQVFTGDPRLLHAGEANRILLPVLGPSSVLLLDDGPHLRQRKLMLPAFHGERMQRYGELMSGIAAAGDRALAARRALPAAPAHAGDDAGDHPARGVRRLRGPAPGALREALRRLLDIAHQPAQRRRAMMLGPDRIAATGRLPSRDRARQPPDLRGDRPPSPAPATSASATTSCRCCCRPPTRTAAPMSDEELRDELMTLLVAGHETTANALAWAGERLCRHPEKLAAAHRGGARRARTATWRRSSRRPCACGR